jgi:carboxylesterase
VTLPQSEWASPIGRTGTSGSAVVMFHGFTGHAGHWLPLADVLHARGHTVVAPLLAGHGTTPDDLGKTGADDWIASARQAVTSLADHDEVHLVGLSMGGIIATILAPEVGAASLTTINAPVRVWDRRIPFAPFLGRVVPIVEAGFEPCPDPELSHLWNPHDRLHTAAVAELVRLIRRGLRRARLVEARALVIQSRVDAVVKPSSAELLASRLGAPILWLDRARHNALLDPERHRIHEAVREMVEG